MFLPKERERRNDISRRKGLWAKRRETKTLNLVIVGMKIKKHSVDMSNKLYSYIH